MPVRGPSSEREVEHGDEGSTVLAASVVVPTFQRPDRLAACLDALRAQDAAAAGHAFEVVIVDDGSEPRVDPALCADPGQAHAIRLLRQANAGPAAARNRGAREARGRLLAFTDDDCRPAPGWLSALIAASAAEEAALLGGRTVNGETDNVFSAASQDLIGFLDAEDQRYFASNNIACAREAFFALGGFASGFPLAGGEDRDLGLRWGASGRPLRRVPDAVVAHHHALTPRGFWRQHANYGRGARHLRARGAEGGGHAFASLAWYAALVSWPLRTRQERGWRRAGLLAAAQLATAWGFATPNRR